MSNIVLLRSDSERGILTVTNDEPDNTAAASESDFTKRVLMSLMFDITMLAKNVERIQVQVFALVKDKGIESITETTE